MLIEFIELDESIGDIHAMIVDKEIKIMQKLSSRILACSQDFTDIVHVLSEVDW